MPDLSVKEIVQGFFALIFGFLILWIIVMNVNPFDWFVALASTVIGFYFGRTSVNLPPIPPGPPRG